MEICKEGKIGKGWGFAGAWQHSGFPKTDASLGGRLEPPGTSLEGGHVCWTCSGKNIGKLT